MVTLTHIHLPCAGCLAPADLGASALQEEYQSSPRTGRIRGWCGALSDHGGAPHNMVVLLCHRGVSIISELPPVGLSVAAFMCLLMGQVLRLTAMNTLGARWTTRIIVLPKVDVVAGGIFKYIRHPNYLGVILEIAALPLVFGCWRTTLGFTVANGALLWVRIQAEEEALS